MQIKFIPPPSAQPPGLLRKAVALVLTVALAVLALMFSAVLLAVILVAVVFGGAYLWWKTRAMRKLMREMQNVPPQGADAGGDVFRGEVFEGEVIEGEVIRVEASRNGERR
ncbi:MAG: hypothetical protein U1C96_01505 [Gallionella sp.]|nr:hypothetical protein [Gallionella sp.]